MRRYLGPRVRLLLKLEERKADGMTRTEVAHFLQVSRDSVNRVLREMIDAFEIVEHVDASQPGRPVTCYWHKKYVPDLTPAAPNDSDLDRSKSPPSGGTGTCQQCGRPTFTLIGRRPQEFCGEACEKLAKTAGISRKSLLARATNPRTFARLCMLFAMEDLLLRGFEVWGPLFLAGPVIMVTDEAGGAARVTVVPVPRGGDLGDLSHYDSIAVVYNDGRVRYAGQNPLVVEPEIVENGAAVTKEEA